MTSTPSLAPISDSSIDCWLTSAPRSPLGAAAFLTDARTWGHTCVGAVAIDGSRVRRSSTGPTYAELKEQQGVPGSSSAYERRGAQSQRRPDRGRTGIDSDVHAPPCPHGQRGLHTLTICGADQRALLRQCPGGCDACTDCAHVQKGLKVPQPCCNMRRLRAAGATRHLSAKVR